MSTTPHIPGTKSRQLNNKLNFCTTPRPQQQQQRKRTIFLSTKNDDDDGTRATGTQLKFRLFNFQNHKQTPASNCRKATKKDATFNLWIFPVRRKRGGRSVDEHCWSLSQPPGDVRLLLPTLLPRPQTIHLALPRNTGRGVTGRGTRILRSSNRLQRWERKKEALDPFRHKHIEKNFFLSANIAKSEYCAVIVTEDKLKAFKYAVKNHYWYQMYLDDLPIWGKNQTH